MTNEIKLDPGAVEIRNALQALFGQVVLSTAYLNNPAIIKECRPGGVVNDSDLTGFEKPQAEWVFGINCGPLQEWTICAAVFTRRDQVEKFLRANEAAQHTTITHWHGSGVVWLRVKGRVPRNFACDGLHWCSGPGFVPVGCPKQSADAFISQVGPLKMIDFNQLVWTEAQQAEIEQLYLEAEVGTPFKIVARGRRRLNTAYWAKWYAKTFSFTFDADRQAFGWNDPATGISVWHSEDDSLRTLAELLQIAARSFPGDFPEGELRPARVRQILERIKLLAKPDRSSGELLDSFLETQTVGAPGEDITSFEFRDRYVTYCESLGRTPCSKSRFFRVLKSKLHSMGIEQRHDIQREGKAVRGYGDLTVKAKSSTKVPDAADAADAADAP